MLQAEQVVDLECNNNNNTGDVQEAIPISRLQEFGINASDLKKLEAAGIYSVAAIFMTTQKQLLAIKGLSEAKVGKLLEAGNKLQQFGFITGLQLAENRKQVFQVSTGSSAFDELLGGGGIESRSITEAFGEFRTGKTQLCHTVAVTAQLPHDVGGGNGKVVFLDTEGTFRPERIRKIAERFGVDGDQVLENITYARCYTSDHQAELLVQVAARMAEDSYSAIIVDSLTALFRVDYAGRGMLAERQQKLGKFLSSLSKLSEEHNVAVLITNQVTADPGGSAMFVGEIRKPIGGHIVAHASATRLYLRKGRGEQRVAKIYDSPCLPESEAIYQLTDGGVDNPKD